MVLDIQKVDNENDIRYFYARLDWVAVQLAVLVGLAKMHPELLPHEKFELLKALQKTLWGLANKDPALDFEIMKRQKIIDK